MQNWSSTTSGAILKKVNVTGLSEKEGKDTWSKRKKDEKGEKDTNTEILTGRGGEGTQHNYIIDGRG
jgi:hypothetical protein